MPSCPLSFCDDVEPTGPTPHPHNHDYLVEFIDRGVLVGKETSPGAPML
ncbi:MAG: hypothetical protein ABSC30_12140 [Acidimicrobiales bacterium]|jgi:hypothetical protein